MRAWFLDTSEPVDESSSSSSLLILSIINTLSEVTLTGEKMSSVGDPTFEPASVRVVSLVDFKAPIAPRFDRFGNNMAAGGKQWKGRADGCDFREFIPSSSRMKWLGHPPPSNSQVSA